MDPARSQSFSQYFGHPPESFRFCSDEPIGRGAYGMVYPGELDGRPVAVKRIHTLLREARDTQGEYIVQSFEEECRRMESLNHPRLVTSLGAYQDDGGPFLVMKRMSQDLRQFLDQNRGNLTLQKQVQLCLDIATGLHYLHSQDTPLVHRDLNDKNILIDKDGRASIADLGQSRLKKKPYEYFATPAPGAMVFMPPEALSKTPHYNEKVDIFSVGVLMLEIATQHEPSPGLEGIGRDQEVERRKEDLDHLPERHPLKQLILKCLQNDPHDRPSAKELLEQLSKLNFPQAKNDLACCINVFLKCLRTNQACLDQIQICPTVDLAKTNHILESLQKMKKANEKEQMKVIFLGNTSSGKSTVLNALIKKKVLPVGPGSTTSCFCIVTGMPPDQLQDGHADGYLKTNDSQEIQLTAVKALANHMKQGSLKAGEILEIFLPAQDSCMWLNQDVVLIDSPGLCADGEVDDLMKKNYGDADVFVCVCNGTSTLEEQVKRCLEHVNRQLPNVSRNLFILFNHWDLVVDEVEDSSNDDSDNEEDTSGRDATVVTVKTQHLHKVQEFLVQGLQANAVLDQTFFVSGKEACKVQENEKKGKPCSESGCGVLKRNWQERWTEFKRFESLLHEYLSDSAIQTKCGRHWESCTNLMQQLIEMMEQFKQWCGEGVEKLDRDGKSMESLLTQVDAAEQTLQQLSGKRVQSAIEEFSKAFDELHDGVKEDVRGKVEMYRKRLDKEKWEDYQKGLTEHLDEAMKKWILAYEQEMRTFITDKTKCFQDSVIAELSIVEPQAEVEQDSLDLENSMASCTEMTKGYRATPWLGRWLLDVGSVFWDEGLKGNLAMAGSRSELITMEGKEYCVPKRYQHSAASVVFSVSSVSGMYALSALFPPSLALMLAIQGIIWAAKPDYQLEQVKGKIINHLKEELDARKPEVKRQCMDIFKSLLESQVENFRAALADKRKDLQQKIAWINQATDFQDQLQQEVKPILDRFCIVYLH